MTNRLVAIDLPGGSGFVDALRRVWANGDAAFPIDRRWPTALRNRVVAAMAPSVMVDMHGELRLDSGRPVEPGDALVVATSGSTGDPRGVVLTHEAILASAKATSARLGVSDDDHWLACLPLAHVGGLSVVTRALALGTRLTVHDGFNAEHVQRSADEGCTLVSLVATALSRIDAERFRRIVLGGARPPDHLPPNCVTTYGLTETGSGVVYDGIALNTVEVRIVDTMIEVRGPMLLRAYRDGTDPKDRDGWLRTGDLGQLRDGRLIVEGRAGDLIITGGENVWPDAVEAALSMHPSVADVAVAGRPDPEWGSAVVAFVVPNGDPPTLEALRTHTKRHVPAFAAPRRLVLVETIPRTALGKVQRTRLPG